jgi:large subunit ribosomal protein L25
MTHTLTATLRSTTGSSAAVALREKKELPAIVYGAQQAATPITLDRVVFEKVWQEAGESSVITLSGVDGVDSVLIQEVQVDPLYQTPIHVDLRAVEANVAIETMVPLVFEGVAPAEKELGGVLVKVMHEIEVRSLPKHLPHEISVDISSLATFDDVLRVRDLSVSHHVEILTDAEETVVLVQAAKEEEAAITDASAVEVEEKGKKEEEAA